MDIRFIPLTLAVKALPPTYALYALRHEPTRRRYVGSTDNIAQRLMNWYYLFEKKPKRDDKEKEQIVQKPEYAPARMKALFMIHGRTAADWTYAVLDQERPANYAPRGNSFERPEYPYIMHMVKEAPALLLNDPAGKNRGRPAGPHRVVGSWGPMGVSPLRYLNVMLGKSPGFKWPAQPECKRPSDPRVLVPVGALAEVPFAEALLRAMLVPPKHLNPTSSAIDGFYQQWRAAQPAGFEAAVGLPGTITTAGQALALPDPSVWMKARLAANLVR